jgi:hypothetical protein
VLLLVEPPATSTKRFHTEVAKIRKKIRIWFEPLSVSGLLKIFVIFAIYCWQFSHDQHQFGNQIHHQQAIRAQGLSKGIREVLEAVARVGAARQYQRPVSQHCPDAESTRTLAGLMSLWMTPR